MNVQEISKILDMSPRRVQQLAKAGIIPRSRRGNYDFVPSIQAYIRYLRAELAMYSGGANHGLTEELHEEAAARERERVRAALGEKDYEILQQLANKIRAGEL